MFLTNGMSTKLQSKNPEFAFMSQKVYSTSSLQHDGSKEPAVFDGSGRRRCKRTGVRHTYALSRMHQCAL